MVKGARIRIVPIVSNTTKLLKNYIKEHDLIDKYDNYVFVNKYNKSINKGWY